MDTASTLAAPQVALLCGKCGESLLVRSGARTQQAYCSRCQRVHEVHLFPAAFRAPKPAFAAPVVGEESACLSHPHKQAVAACEMCGRFMCDLCAIPLDGKHICVTCLDKGPALAEVTTLQDPYLRYDHVALLLGLASLILPFIGVVFAPVTLYLVLRYFRKPISVVPRNRWRFVAAAVFALVSLVSWIPLVGVTFFP